MAALTFAACGGSANDDEADDDADVYTAVIRSVAPGDASVMPKIVYVELVEGAELTLEDQAAVVNAFAAPTTVRFVDERAEAVDDGLPQSHVRRDGVLVTLDRVRDTDEGRSVKATRYVARGDEYTVCVALTEQDHSWTVASKARC